MKEKRCLLIALAITLLAGGGFVLLIRHELTEIRANSNQAMMQIIAAAKERVPELSDVEIAEILNGKKDEGQLQESLEKYGITKESWLAVQNDAKDRQMIFLAAAFVAVEAILVFLFFLYYRRLKKSELQKITKYMMRINDGAYKLDIEENTEDDMSLLKNEIYKTTVLLREQRENSIQDKINLKNSLSDISHQLKTPLTSIVVMIETILDDKEMPEEVRLDFLKDIRRSAGHISFLVQSLLVLSKLDANSMELKKKEESAAEIFEETLKNTEILAEVCGVSVSSDCAPDCIISCDYKWTIEALGNIVKNCIEHTPSGGSVTMRARSNKLYTKIEISDTGEGIDKEDLPHIFERFYKGKNSREDSVGIGLALAKMLIEKNDGMIRVESVKGKGTTFVIKFFYGEIA